MTKYFVEIDEEIFVVEVTPEGVTVDGESTRADLARVSGTNLRSLLLEDRSFRVVGDQIDTGQWHVRMGGDFHVARVVDERRRHIEELTGSSDGPKGPAPIKAPMPGLVVRIEVEEGDIVTADQGIVIVEAMKMENELKSQVAARVGVIHVSEGQAVEKGTVLIDLEPIDTDSPE